jgi:hypothetical protein
MAEIIGTTSTAKVAAGDKYRVTWQFILSSVLPSWAYYDAPDIANRLREWLPGQGFVPVSMPSAVSGQEVMVFDVRLSQEWSNSRNVAQVLSALEDTPWFWSLKVQKLEKLSTTLTSSQLQEGQEAAITEGETKADTNPIEEALTNAMKKLKEAFGDAAQLVALVAIATIVVGGVYLYRESKK